MLVRAAASVASRLDLLVAVGPPAAARHRLTARSLSRRGAPPQAAVNLRIWSDAARALGAELRQLDGDVLEIRRGERRARVWRHVTGLDDPVALRVALDRPLVHRMLRDAGVPVPEHVEFPAVRPGPALELLRRAGGPFVVKPARGSSGGHGITCAVRTPLDALRACAAAARFDDRLVLERQADGEMHRLLFLDGELLAAVRRGRPRVAGDGRSTVAELIAAENRSRLAAGGELGVVLLRPDLDCILTLRAQGLGLRSVPPAGTTVVVKTATSENAPRDNETVQPAASDPVVRQARDAVGAVGLRLAGVDVVTSDLGQGLEPAGRALIEVNGTPGLHYHYLVGGPEGAVRVAVRVLSRLLEQPEEGPASGGGAGRSPRARQPGVTGRRSSH